MVKLKADKILLEEEVSLLKAQAQVFILFYFVLFCFILFYFVLFCFILFYFISFSFLYMFC